MVEAVNNILQTAPVSALQANSNAGDRNARADVAAEAIEQAETKQTVQAPFISPAIYVDLNYNTAVLQIRDSDTGDVERTIPSRSALETRQIVEGQIENKRQQAEALARKTTESAEPAVQSQITQEQVQIARQQNQVTSEQVQSARQVAAFQNAARSGDSNAGTFSIFA